MFGTFLSVAVAMSIKGSALPPPAEMQQQPGDGAVVARRVGLGPTVLTVSGVTAPQASAVLTRIEQAAGLQVQLDDLRSQIRLLGGRIGQLRGQLRRDPANGELLGHLRQARVQLTTARTQLGTLRGSIANAGAVGLSAEVVQRMTQSRVASNRLVPPEMLCVERSQQQWKRLEADLVVERRALRQRQSVPTVVASRLASERAREAVVAARQALATQLASIQALFGPS